ncbi:replication protein RepA [Azospirillum brasilense]|uniref:replication protein RepA n=1 Tax=Azospirillum brasilense TaxID=192 RepID=UPI000E688217|nr:replication protein RepA [Azospirillum brasilense]NUB24733.1 hypothetical protein [Azospirillum brasilense]NUB30663.1 hypothetical protein [Azospirillum brasilense]RIW08273.1 hypothetical protein D2T81_00750 [Azospirillum brasilense]
MSKVLYIPRVFAVFGLPHSDPATVKDDNGLSAPFNIDPRYWVRRDGGGYDASWLVKRSWLTVQPGEAGLPFGKWAKLLTIMLATAARETDSRTIRLGSINETLSMMGIESASGGETGNIAPLKDALNRLLGAEFTYLPHESDAEINEVDDGVLGGREYVRKLREGREAWLADWLITVKSGFRLDRLPDEKAVRFRIAESASLWSDGAKDAVVTLSEEFYEMATKDEVALDEDTVRRIQRSAINLDVYCFINARTRWNESGVTLLPILLAHQLGSVGPSRELKRRFKEAVDKIIEKGWADLDVRYTDGKAELQWTGRQTKGTAKPELDAGSKKSGTITILTDRPHVKSVSMKKAAEQAVEAKAEADAEAVVPMSQHDRLLVEARSATPQSWIKKPRTSLDGIDDFGS